MANYPYKRPGTQLDDFREAIIEFMIAVEQDIRSTNTAVSKVVAKGDSSPQAAAAMVDAFGKAYNSLKERMDAEQKLLNAINDTKRDKSTRIRSSELDTSSDANKIKAINLSEEVKKMMAGNTPINAEVAKWGVNNDHVARGAIPAEKLDFTPLTGIQTKNLFDKTKVTENKILTTAGAMVDNPYEKDGIYFDVSDFIPVEPGETYTKAEVDISCFYTLDKKFISYVSTGYTMTAPDNAFYIRLTIARAKSEKYQFEKGDKKTNFVPYGFRLDPKTIAEKVIDDTHLKNQYTKKIYGKNLFNKETAIQGQYIAFFSGALTPGTNFAASDFIEIEPGQTYTKNDTQQFAFYNEYMGFVSGLDKGTTFTAPANVKYVRVTVPLAKINEFQLEKGENITGYEEYFAGIDPKDIRRKSIKDEHLKESYAKMVLGKNLFNKSTVTTGKYVEFQYGTIVNGPGYSASDYIPVKGGTTYIKKTTQQLAFYKSDYSFIRGIDIVNGPFQAPDNAAYVRITVKNTELDMEQLEEGTKSTAYQPYGYFIPKDSVQDFDTIPYIHEKNMKIQLPRYIYLTVGESFSIYWRNIIKLSNKLKSGDYYTRVQKLETNGTYSPIGDDYGQQWTYTPTEEGETTIEIRLYNINRDEVIDRKQVTLVSKNKNFDTPKEADIITVGDSFTDQYKVSKFLHDFVSESTNAKLNMIGLHDTGKAGVKDDAWSGYNYEWYYGTQTAGLVRTDRPLKDAIWEPGWGKNEEFGWKEGQTWADLTTPQRLHGKTTNQFYNPETKKFDFAYYMTRNFPEYVPSSQTGKHINGFISFLGLNDSIWRAPATLNASLPTFVTRIKHIIDSVQGWDPNIVVMLHLVTTQQENDRFMNTYNNTWLHSSRAKYAQELWNEMMLSNFDTDEMRARNVHVVATNAHFNPVTGIKTETIKPDKFDQTYTQVVTSDVHPTETGAKYIADVGRNFILQKIFK